VPPPSGHLMVKIYQTTDQIRMLSVQPKYMRFEANLHNVETDSPPLRKHTSYLLQITTD
jgi:hypothetical protein